jgi:hypothetical protein
VATDSSMLRTCEAKKAVKVAASRLRLPGDDCLASRRAVALRSACDRAHATRPTPPTNRALQDHGAMAQTLAYIQNTLLYPLGAQCNLAAYDQQAQLQVSSLERTLAAARPHNQPGSSAIASCSAAVQSAIADSESLLDDAAWCAIAPLFGQLLDAAALEARTVQQLLERALAANQEVADDTGLRILRVLRLAQQLPELQPCGVNVSRGMVRAFGLAVSLVDKVSSAAAACQQPPQSRNPPEQHHPTPCQV